MQERVIVEQVITVRPGTGKSLDVEFGKKMSHGRSLGKILFRKSTNQRWGERPHITYKELFVKTKPVPLAAVLRQKSWSVCRKKIAAASAAAAAARDAALPPACSSVLKGQLAWAEHIFWRALRQDGRLQAYACEFLQDGVIMQQCRSFSFFASLLQRLSQL